MRRTITALVLCLISMCGTMAQIHNTKHIDVAILGDSNTWIGGDDCNKEKGWNKWFKDLFRPASCKSYARSGATWTNTEVTKANTEENIGVLGNDNVIYNQILRLQQAVESGEQVVPGLIIIAAGTNDAWFQDKRPGIFDMGTEMALMTVGDDLSAIKVNEMTSLAQSVFFGIALLRESFPDAQIVLLTPLQCVATSLENIQKVGDVIAECADACGISYIRQDSSDFLDREVESEQKHFTYDGTHTNAKGARHNAEKLAQIIPLMLRKY